MILHLLLLLAASRAAQSRFEDCPKDAACLYHASCPDPSKPDAENNLATYFPSEFDRWSVEHCRAYSPNKTELIIRPLSDHTWNITLRYTLQSVGITFGESLLTLNAKEKTAVFKSPTKDKPTKYVYRRNEKSVSFKLHYSDKKLLDLFHDSKISYANDGAPIGQWKEADQKHLWSRIGALIDGCNDNIITDDCTLPAEMNCAKPTVTKHQAKCTGEEKIWLKNDDSKWVGLNSVDCNYDTIKWTLTKEKEDNVPVPTGGLTIRCATEQPEPSTTESPKSTESTTADPSSAEPTTSPNEAKGIYPTFIVPILIYLACF